MDEILPYGDIADLHRQASEQVPYFRGTSLPQFSALMNQATGSHAYDQGLSDNWIKQGSHALDRFLRPVSQVTGDIGAAATRAVAPRFEPLGRQLGESIPRSLGELGAVTAGVGAMASSAPFAVPLGIGALIAGAGSAGAKAYTETGNPAVGGLSAGLTALVPGSASLGREMVKPALKSIFYQGGKPIAARSGIAKFVEPLAEYTGANIGMTINQEAQIQGSSLLQGMGLQDPTTAEGLFERFGGQIPFMMVDAVRMARGPRPEAGQPGRYEQWRSEVERDVAASDPEVQEIAKQQATFQANNRIAEVDALKSQQKTAEKPKTPVPPVTKVPETMSTFKQPEPYKDGPNVWLEHTQDLMRGFRRVQSAPVGSTLIELPPHVRRGLQEAGLIDDKGTVIARPKLDDSVVVQEARALSQPETQGLGTVLLREGATEPTTRLVAAAFRDPATGQVYNTGKSHTLTRDMPSDPAVLQGLEDGFIDESGQFVPVGTAANLDPNATTGFGNFLARFRAESGSKYEPWWLQQPKSTATGEETEVILATAFRNAKTGDVTVSGLRHRLEPGNREYDASLEPGFWTSRGRFIGLTEGEKSKLGSEFDLAQLAAITAHSFVPETTAKSQKASSVQYRIPDDLAELRAMDERLTKLDPEDNWTELHRRVITKIRAIEKNMGFKDRYEGMFPAEMFMTQLEQKFGPKAGEALVDAPPEVKLQHLSELTDMLIGVLNSAAEGHKYKYLIDRRDSIRSTMSELIQLGLPLDVAFDRVYRSYIQLFSRVLEDLDPKPKPGEVKLNPVGEAFDQANEKRALQFMSLPDDEQQVVYKFLKSGIYSKQEIDLNSVAYGEAVRFHQDPTVQQRRLKQIKAVLGEEIVQPGFAPEGGIINKPLKNQDPRAIRAAMIDPQRAAEAQRVMRGTESVPIEEFQKVMASRESYLKALKYHITEETKENMREYRKRWRMESESQKTEIDEDPLMEKEKVEAKPNITPESTAMIDEQRRVMSALPDTDVNGWSQGGVEPFKRKVEEQVSRLNAAMKLLREGAIGFGRAEFRPKTAQEDLIVKAPLTWKDIGRAMGMGASSERFVRQFIREQFVPRLKARLGGKVETRGGATDNAYTEAGLPANVGEPAQTYYNTIIGAKQWFGTWLRTRGHSETEVELFSGIAERMAAAFHDVGYARLGELLSKKNQGLFWTERGPGANALILLNRGLDSTSPEQAVFLRLFTWGHELWHGLIDARLHNRLSEKQTEFVDNAIATVSKLEPEVRGALNHRYMNIVLPKRLAMDPETMDYYVQGVQQSRKAPGEFLADFAGLLALGHVSPDKSALSKLRPELLFEAADVQQFAKGLYVPLYEVATMMKDYFNETTPGRHPAGTYMADVAEAVKGTLRSLEHVDRAVDELNRYRANDLPGYLNLLQDATVGPVSESALYSFLGMQPPQARGGALIEAAKEFMGRGATRAEMEKVMGVQPGFFARYFMPSAQLSALYPHLQPTFDIVRSFRPMANLVATKIAAPFMAKTSKFGKTHIDTDATGLHTLFKSERAAKVADRIRMDKQTEERVFDDAELKSYTADLTDEEARAVVAFNRAYEEAMPLALDMMLAYDERHVSRVGAAMLQAKMDKDKPLKHTAYIGLAEGMLKALKASLSPDDITRQTGLLELERMQATIGNGFVSAMNVMRPMFERVVEKANELNKSITKNAAGTRVSYYMPEYRSGKFNVVWKKKGEKPGRIGVDTFEEANAHKKRLEAEGAEKVRIWSKYDEQKQTAGMHPDLLKRFMDIESAKMENAIKELGFDSDALKAFREHFTYTPGEETMSQVKGRGVERFSMKRSLAPGREYVDTVKTSIDYIQRLSTGLAKRAVTDEVGLALNDHELKANPRLQDVARQHFDNVINPTGPEWSAFKKMNFAYFMAFNVSSMLIEGAQSLLTFMPQITRDTGSIATSFKVWGAGVKTAVESVVRGGKISDPDLEKAVKWAQDNQRLDFGTMQEFHMDEENALPNLSAILNGRETLSPGEIAKKPLYWYLNGSRWLYSQATRANSYTAFIAAYQHARKSMTHEQAREYAASTVDKTMFGGGASARPVGMFNLLHGSRAYGAMGVLYSLGTYTFSTIAMMSRLGKEAISKSTAISPKDKAAAQKAFGQMMLTQVALGGALSLPFAGATLALLEQLFPGIQAKQGLKDMFASLAGDDEELGNFVSDIALKGAPSRYLNVDLSSRMSLSQLMGVSPYDGFSVANLLGPTGSVFANMASGVNQLATGNTGDAIKSLMPVPYKNIIDLYNDGGAIRDKSGALIYEPTAAEASLFALGLRPKRLTDFRETQRNIERAENIEKMRNAQFFEQQAQEFQMGNIAGVRQALQQRAQEQVMFDPVTGGRRVVEEVEKRMWPIDLARSGSRGNATERQRLQTQLGGRGLPTEVQRLQTRQQLSAQLGLPPVQSKTALSIAMMTDQLMQMNPALSRQEALLTVERMFGRGMQRQF